MGKTVSGKNLGVQVLDQLREHGIHAQICGFPECQLMVFRALVVQNDGAANDHERNSNGDGDGAAIPLIRMVHVPVHR